MVCAFILYYVCDALQVLAVTLYSKLCWFVLCIWRALFMHSMCTAFIIFLPSSLCAFCCSWCSVTINFPIRTYLNWKCRFLFHSIHIETIIFIFFWVQCAHRYVRMCTQKKNKINRHKNEMKHVYWKWYNLYRLERERAMSWPECCTMRAVTQFITIYSH